VQLPDHDFATSPSKSLSQTGITWHLLLDCFSFRRELYAPNAPDGLRMISHYFRWEILPPFATEIMLTRWHFWQP